ncbi:phage N-6-adenine-methyltransferase [Erwinia endophytica]|uniref:phage N-6-adenine-methyltransferase n=1 Tax=Erwinia endophytica TaxID=1563158 RepID=UPI001265D885|nr:phage N-6-adenine-methyltransferase [Erwinia endophytica]KAB8312953.1 phage N-6-adenine-methyltransferase [Erwinia endophytica]
MTDKSNTAAEIKDAWQTPPEIFLALNAEFSFTLDAAADADNALCRHYITEEQNTLETSWKAAKPDIPGYVWLNPPYSDVCPFVQKAAAENADNAIGCVMLLNSDTSVGWFREAISSAHEVRFITGGRLSFLNATTGKPVSGNNRGQMLVIWHPWPRTHCEFKTVDRDVLMRFGARLIERAA